MLEDPEYYVKYLITAYPDYADGGQFVTEIEITDPNVSVYGLTVNSSFDEFDSVFDKMEYTIERKEELLGSSHSAVKDGLYFMLKEENGERVLSIRVTVTNREDIIF